MWWETIRWKQCHENNMRTAVTVANPYLICEADITHQYLASIRFDSIQFLFIWVYSALVLLNYWYILVHRGTASSEGFQQKIFTNRVFPTSKSGKNHARKHLKTHIFRTRLSRNVLNVPHEASQGSLTALLIAYHTAWWSPYCLVLPVSCIAFVYRTTYRIVQRVPYA